MSQKIQEALSKLDVTNDNHWTVDGLPRLDTVKMLANDPSLTRDAVTAAVPGFTRTSAAQGAQAPAPAPAPVTPAPVAETAPAAPQAAAPEVAPVVQPEVTPVVTPPETEQEAVTEHVVTTQEALAEAQKKLAELAKTKAQVEAAYNAQIKKVDALILQVQSEQTGDTNAAAIRAYLDRQIANGQERARRMEALKGIDLGAILPKKAPIDMVRSRPLGHGMRRK